MQNDQKSNVQKAPGLLISFLYLLPPTKLTYSMGSGIVLFVTKEKYFYVIVESLSKWVYRILYVDSLSGPDLPKRSTRGEGC